MNSRYLPLLILGLFFISCTSHIENTPMNPKREHVPKQVKGDLSEAKKTDENVSIEEDVIVTDEMPQEKTMANMLEGKWRSVEDHSNLLIFENGQRKEIAGSSTNWNIEDYQLSNKCLNEIDKDNGILQAEDKYISCKESDMCWYIINLNDSRLDLSYMGRGNTLVYEKFR